jgi:5-methylcytosine-specific restriction protein A
MTAPRRRCVNYRTCRQYVPCPIHTKDAGRPSATQRGYGADWRKTRALALERDGHRCTHCGSTERLNVDHIVARAKGGTDDLTNLRTLCHRCHASKTAKLDNRAFGGDTWTA